AHPSAACGLRRDQSATSWSASSKSTTIRSQVRVSATCRAAAPSSRASPGSLAILTAAAMNAASSPSGASRAERSCSRGLRAAAARHRLERYVAESLGHAREEEDIGRRVVRGELGIGLAALDYDADFPAAQLVGKRPLPDQHQLGVGPDRAHRLVGADHDWKI